MACNADKHTREEMRMNAHCCISHETKLITVKVSDGKK